MLVFGSVDIQKISTSHSNKKMWDLPSPRRGKPNMLDTEMSYTTWKINMDPENDPVENENNLPKPHNLEFNMLV